MKHRFGWSCFFDILLARATTKLKFMIFMNTKWANKKLLIFLSQPGIRNQIRTYSKSRETQQKKCRGDDDEREFTHFNPYLYYLFWKIYREFNTFWSINAIFMVLKNVNIELFSSSLYLFNLHSSFAASKKPMVDAFHRVSVSACLHCS